MSCHFKRYFNEFDIDLIFYIIFIGFKKLSVGEFGKLGSDIFNKTLIKPRKKREVKKYDQYCTILPLFEYCKTSYFFLKFKLLKKYFTFSKIIARKKDFKI